MTTTSPEALREAVERLTAHAEFIGQPDAGVVMVATPRHVVAADLSSVLAELSLVQDENERLKGLARRINMSAVLIPGLNGEAAVSGALIAELAAAIASQDQGGGDRG